MFDVQRPVEPCRVLRVV